MKNYDGLLNKKEKKRKNILVVRLWPMKRKQLGLLRVIDISKKKKKKKKEKEKRKEKKKEKRKEKRKGKNILVVRLWPMKRKQPGLLRVIDIS